MIDFVQLKKVAQEAQESQVPFTINSTQILELLAIRAQLVEALKLFSDFPQDVLTMPADEHYTFSVQGWYFAKAIAALAAAGE